MSELHVLLIHGMTGSGPWHWQQWLARELAAQDGVRAELLALPEPDSPSRDAWLPALRVGLDEVPRDAELVVAAHGCGVALWLHHAATVAAEHRRADRVLLAAPPDPSWWPADVHGLMPYPVDARALREAGSSTRVVAGTGDPFLPVPSVHALADALQVELDVVADGEHLNTDSGYGRWPSVLRWALYGAVPLRDRFDQEPLTVAYAPARLRPV